MLERVEQRMRARSRLYNTPHEPLRPHEATNREVENPSIRTLPDSVEEGAGPDFDLALRRGSLTCDALSLCALVCITSKDELTAVKCRFHWVTD